MLQPMRVHEVPVYLRLNSNAAASAARLGDRKRSRVVQTNSNTAKALLERGVHLRLNRSRRVQKRLTAAASQASVSPWESGAAQGTGVGLSDSTVAVQLTNASG